MEVHSEKKSLQHLLQLQKNNLNIHKAKLHILQ